MKNVSEESVLLSILIVLVVVMVGLAISTNSFGSRCTKAGYEGPDHEYCVHRLKNGGPLYEENIGRF